MFIIRLRNDSGTYVNVCYCMICLLDENNKRYANDITDLIALNGVALICVRNKSDKS